MEKWYFTFGMASPLSKFYVELEGNKESTREDMFQMFGNRWAFQYREDEKASAVDRFGLIKLPLVPDRSGHLKLNLEAIA